MAIRKSAAQGKCNYFHKHGLKLFIFVPAISPWLLDMHMQKSHPPFIYMNDASTAGLFLSFSSLDSCSHKRVKSAGTLPRWPIEWQAQ